MIDHSDYNAMVSDLIARGLTDMTAIDLLKDRTGRDYTGNNFRADPELEPMMRQIRAAALDAIMDAKSGRLPSELKETDKAAFKMFNEAVKVRTWADNYLESGEEEKPSGNPERNRIMKAIMEKSGITDPDKIPTSAYLLALAEQDEFVMNQDGEIFVATNTAIRRKIMDMGDKDYTSILADRYERTFGIPVTENSIKSGLLVIPARTTIRRRLFNRVGGYGVYTMKAEVFYDLKDGTAVRIVPDQDGEGVSIVPVPPIFIDYPVSGPQVKPDLTATINDMALIIDMMRFNIVPGEDLEYDEKGNVKACPENFKKMKLRGEFSGDIKRFLCSWMICDLLAWFITMAGLSVNGEPGSGKSALTRILAALIDPISLDVNEEPGYPADMKEGQDLELDLAQRYLPVYDNIGGDGLAKKQNDTMSQVITGIQFKRRLLYTNGKIVIVNVRKPPILNGVANSVRLNDTGERYVLLALQAFTAGDKGFMTDKELWIKFMALRPRMMGALFKTLSKTLYVLAEQSDDDRERTQGAAMSAPLDEEIEAEMLHDDEPMPPEDVVDDTAKEKPRQIVRFGDFMRIGRVAGEVIEEGGGDRFARTYLRLQSAQSNDVLEEDEVAQVILSWAYENHGKAGQKRISNLMSPSLFKAELIKHHVTENDLPDRRIPTGVERKLLEMSPHGLVAHLKMTNKDLAKHGVVAVVIPPIPGAKGKNSGSRIRIRYRGQ